jgi:hypothetical protein
MSIVGTGGKEGGSIGKQWENSVEVTLFKFMESQLKKHLLKYVFKYVRWKIN